MFTGSFGFDVNVKVAKVFFLAPEAMFLLASRNRNTVFSPSTCFIASGRAVTAADVVLFLTMPYIPLAQNTGVTLGLLSILIDG